MRPLLRGCVYSKIFTNLDPRIQVSNGISPPKTKIDSIIRDSTWISEFARLDFGQLGYPSCPRTSKFPKHPSFACARKFVRVQCRLCMVHCTNSCACESFARCTFSVSSYGEPYTPRTPSAFVSHIITASSCCAPLQ